MHVNKTVLLNWIRFEVTAKPKKVDEFLSQLSTEYPQHRFNTQFVERYKSVINPNHDRLIISIKRAQP